MEQKQKDALWAQYTKQTHRLGRVLSLITVALLLGAPFVIGALLGAYPDLGATARGFLSVGLVWTVSRMTIVILALGVLALVPLQPVLQSPALQPAFANVVPALFGAMAYQYYRKNIVVAIAPLVVMSVLFTLVPGLISSASFMIIPSGALAIGIAYTIYKKKKQEAQA